MGLIRNYSWRRRAGDLRIAGLTALAIVVAGVMNVAMLAWNASIPLVVGVAVVLIGLVAALAARQACRARTRTGGIEARFWRLIAAGLASWAFGAVPYLAFLLSGGDPRDPQAWTQIGFLIAYPFWYRALWLIRQPVLAESRRQRVDSWLIELATFGMLGILVVGVLWFDALPADQNAALLVPSVLDLLLLASLYNAARRVTIDHEGALVWLAYAVAALAVTDGAVTYLTPRGAIAGVTLGMIGYVGAMGLFAIAARRRLRVLEARRTLASSKLVLASMALAMSGPASALAPAALRPALWAVGGWLLWRLWALLRDQGRAESDPLTGLLDARAFARHVGGVSQAATIDQPALLLGVDLNGFGIWNAERGYHSGDSLLLELGKRLEGAGLPGGIWTRLAADRFAWVGLAGSDPHAHRALAESVQTLASDNAGKLRARVATVVLPSDAATAANALAAADEALLAARQAKRDVVAFDHGRLEGIEISAGGYSASLAQRRQLVQAVLADPRAIVPVVQPIVTLETGEVVGYEALARFHAEPTRGPDRWIAEAHAVGLGLEVELECVRRARALADSRPSGTYVSINVSPQALLATDLEAALGPGSLDWLVIEITEHDQIADYARVAARLALLRGRGARVAVDDTGAGHSSLRHVMNLRPDFIKLDRSLIQGIHQDHAKRALLRSLVALDEELGTILVAEGVESTDELRELRNAGVVLGQGYLFARPGPGFATEVDLPGVAALTQELAG